MRVTTQMTSHLATLRESKLLPPFTRAWLNFLHFDIQSIKAVFTLRQHHFLAIAMLCFNIDSQIPPVRTSSKLVVNRTPDAQSLPKGIRHRMLAAPPRLPG